MPLLSIIAAVAFSAAPAPALGVSPPDTMLLAPAADSNALAVRSAASGSSDSLMLRARLQFRLSLAADTVRRRPKAIEVSDAYEMRLRIHRYASYTMIPLFAVQTVAGNQLFQADKSGAEKPGWAKGTHVVGATGLAALFTINTVTGAWNFWESRGNETGRTKRWIHSILLLASDAGFTYSGISAGEAEDSQDTRNRHRNVSYAAMASALAGYAVMLVGDH